MKGRATGSHCVQKVESDNIEITNRIDSQRDGTAVEKYKFSVHQNSNFFQRDIISNGILAYAGNNPTLFSNSSRTEGKHHLSTLQYYSNVPM